MHSFLYALSYMPFPIANFALHPFAIMNLSHKYDYIESYESPLLITKFEGGLEWPDMLVISK